MNQKAIYLLFIISLLSIGNAGIIREEGQCKDKNGNPCRKIIDNKKDFNINNRNIKKRSFFKSLFEERDKDNYWLNNDTMGDTFNQPYIDNNNSPKIPPSSGSNLPTVNTPSNVKSLPPKNTLSDVNNTPPKSIPSNNSIYNDEYSQNNSQNSAQNSAQNNSQNTSSNGNRKNFLGGLFDSLPDDYFDIFGIGDYLQIIIITMVKIIIMMTTLIEIIIIMMMTTLIEIIIIIMMTTLIEIIIIIMMTTLVEIIMLIVIAMVTIPKLQAIHLLLVVKEDPFQLKIFPCLDFINVLHSKRKPYKTLLKILRLIVLLLYMLLNIKMKIVCLIKYF
ncbi:hypothetical protein H8356DRAFT_1060133 [Neocallimastix lanati (nom. inval.)]|uniref:Uncharacterized protein n=1 Tax=Neocallimastix californiae TaxID=1754190 RepID=A0A1Y2AC69_9FUNG|nr:hypothetical protein H8356DRAFT_1060133 [Neocallimastix sp. JGI-2020a]ORY20128.1 hypothetical protein LY90DRAFT_161061 [Neocallimastix californiae]|eukprot:ORY20128.1 hypothetical protein LY90DRAFT_161061 [Neocallimastix californiae]